MYAIYVAVCEEKRLYVGMTKQYRMKERMNEHWNPNFLATRWTTKYPVVEFVCTFPVGSKKKTLLVEHQLTERLMEIYGLDAVRGGNYVMWKEGGTWWVHPKLRHIPRFTRFWASLSARSFVEFARNDPFLFEVRKLHQSFSGSPLPLEPGQDEHQP